MSRGHVVLAEWIIDENTIDEFIQQFIAARQTAPDLRGDPDGDPQVISVRGSRWR